MKKCILLTLGVASISAASQANIVNGDFELGNTGFASDYIYNAPTFNALYEEGEYTVATNSNIVHDLWANLGDHTTGSGNYFIANGSDDANFVVWTGNSDTALVIGETYSFSAWVANIYPDNPAALTFDVSGVALNAVPVSPTGVGEWTQISATFVATSTNPTFTLLNQQTATGGNDFGVDDISVNAVPEPASMIALGLGGMALLRRRRKSA